MICTDERRALLDEFSQQVRRHFPIGVWRSLFLDRTGTAQFGSATRALLCVECPESGPLTRDGVVAALARLAPAHSGSLDPCADRYAFVSFPTPDGALRFTMALQRRLGRALLRMSLVTGRCRMVRSQADGQDILMVLGRERARATLLADRAATGTVQLSVDTYEALGDTMADELGSCVVTTEFDGDVLREITLTLPPDGSADLSTFAGLGLT